MLRVFSWEKVEDLMRRLYWGKVSAASYNIT